MVNQKKSILSDGGTHLKFRKINDTTINCIITQDDLRKHGIDLDDLSKDLREKLDEAFASDKQVFYFPAGACSRKIDGKIQDLPWKKSFITKSRESKRDIIPMWFSGRNSNRFYNVDWIRKKLKIKTNIAMFFLPDEVYRSRNKEYTMVIGKPIPYTTFTSEKSDAEWAAWVRGKTYELNNAE